MQIKTLGLAHALGDSLGAQYEFRFNASRQFIHGFHYVPRIVSRFQGERHGVIGQWTDDTEMALSLYQSLKATEFEYDQDSVIIAYLEWANSKPFGMGKTTRTLLHGITTLKGYRNRYAKLKATCDSQSNGSLMRAWPLVFAKDRHDAVIFDTQITNPNSINTECGLIYIDLLYDLLHDIFDKEKLNARAQECIYPDIKLAMEQALSGSTRTFNKGQNGWVVHGLYFAIIAVISDDPPLKIYDDIIQMKIDPDTTCAIAGAVIGAKYWRTFLQIPDIKSLIDIVVSVDTTKGEFPRSDKFHPKLYTY